MKTKKLLLIGCLATFVNLSIAQTFDIYVSDAAGFGPPNKILKYDENGENPEVFIGEDELDWPQDILFLEAQNVVLISNLNSGRITRHNAQTGAYIDDFATVTGGPTRMEIGPGDLIYVLQWGGNGTVLRYQQDGTFEDAFTSVGVFQSIGMDWDSDGNFYVSSYGGSSIRQYNSSGEDQGLFISSGLAGPTNIRFDSNGELIVLNWNNGALQRYDAGGTLIETFDTGINQAEGISFYPNGDFLVGHGADSSVKLYDASGNFIEEIVATSLGGLIRPNAVRLRDSSLSIDEFELTESSIFINSIGSVFTINHKLWNQEGTINIFDINGKLVVSDLQTNKNRTWQPETLEDGIYLVQLEINSKKQTQKILLKR